MSGTEARLKDSQRQATESTNFGSKHWVVVPIFGDQPTTSESLQHHLNLHEAGFGLVFVDNNPYGDNILVTPSFNTDDDRLRWVCNGNRGGVAGGFNRGIIEAMEAGAGFITLLDQDSSLDSQSLQYLREPLEQNPRTRLLVGPRIWDQRRAEWHKPSKKDWQGYRQKRMLISSGTTFATRDWALLGPMDEELFIDFVDHAWCFRAQIAGFVLLEHPQAVLEQQFGAPHPHTLCRMLGMELYSPTRHYYSLRNLRWLARQWWIPLDIRIKEVIKMLLKPWLWLICEPQRYQNLKAVVSALRDPIPATARRRDVPKRLSQTSRRQ